MNLLECYIKEVHSEEDVSQEYEKVIKRTLEQLIIKATMTVVRYGVAEKTTKYFLKSDWEAVKKKGYFLD